MKVKKYQKKIEVIDNLKIIELSKCYAIEISEFVGGEAEYFVDKKDFNAAKQNYEDMFDVINNIKRDFYYYNDSFWKHLKEWGFHSDKTFKLMEKSIIKPVKAIKLKDFSEDNIAWFKSYDHTIYRLGEQFPIAIPHFIDYICGINDREYDLEKAYKKLKDSPFVTKIEKIDIPYYNCEEGQRNKAIEFIFHTPQSAHNLLYVAGQFENKTFGPYISVQDLFLYRSWNKNLDILGLKDCWIGEK